MKKYNATVEKLLGRKLEKSDKLSFKGKVISIGDKVKLNGDLHVDFD